VLLSNGVGTSENFWRYLVAALRDSERVVHWDYRGHGHSEPSRSGVYSLEAHADDLARVIDAAGDPRPVHIAFSMGVPVVLELFRRRPETVPAAIWIAGAPDAPAAGQFPWTGLTGVALHALMDAASPVVPKLAPAVRRLLHTSIPYPLGRALGVLQPRAPREEIEQMMRRLDPVAFYESLRGLMRADASDVLARFGGPALIVAARDDKLVGPRQMQRMRALLPQARYVEVEDAGHASLLEAGAEIAREVKAFLAALPRDARTPR
jgi:pimeloyl-ACP methyl ester carboxylesterase